MKFLKKYNTYNDFLTDYIYNGKIMCAYIEENDNILLCNSKKQFTLTYEITPSIINTASNLGTKIPLITRCDLFKSIIIDGKKIDMSNKIRTPYIFKSNNIIDIGNELQELIMPNNNFNEDYVLLTDLEEKKGTLTVEFIDEIPSLSLIGLFFSCWSVTSISPQLFKQINTDNISYMFAFCTNLKNINLSYLNFMNIKYCDFLFYNCIHLSNIYIPKYDERNVISNQLMFGNCYALK